MYNIFWKYSGGEGWGWSRIQGHKEELTFELTFLCQGCTFTRTTGAKLGYRVGKVGPWHPFPAALPGGGWVCLWALLGSFPGVWTGQGRNQAVPQWGQSSCLLLSF